MSTITVDTYPEQENYWKERAKNMKRASRNRYFYNPQDWKDTVNVVLADKDAPVIKTRQAKWKATRFYDSLPQFTNHFSTEQAAVNYVKAHGYKEYKRSL